MKRPVLPYFKTASAIVAVATVIGLAGCEDNAEPYDYNSADNISALTISPGSKTLGLGVTYATFTANGGTPPYAWAVSDTSLGTIPDTDFAVITYSRESTSVGANVIRVTDVNGWTAEAVITQNSTAVTP